MNISMTQNRMVSAFLVLFHFLSVVVAAPVSAQSEDYGTQGLPRFVSVVPSISSAGVLTITARVQDDGQISSVLLFYRIAGERNYKQQKMGLSGVKNTYNTTLSKLKGQSGSLEYYLVATDSDGNSMTEGLSFNPLVAALPVRQTESRSNPIVNNKKTVYVVLGVLAAAALAGMASSGGGSSGSSSGTNDCAQAGCSLQLQFTNP